MATLQQLFDHYVHVGHRTDRWNPKMRSFILDTFNGAHVFDLEKTLENLEKAQKFLAAVKLKNGKILFVGTKPQVSMPLQEKLEGKKHYYVDESWAPGLLTNFDELRKRIDYYLNLKAQFESGEIHKYTKKEVSQFKKELEKLHKVYHGVAEMRKRPDVVVVLDAVGNRLAIEEARKIGASVVALTDSNADPDGIDYPIPANDDSMKSVGFLIDALLESFEK